MARSLFQFKRNEKVLVVWVDACSTDEWKRADKIKLSPELIQSVGFVFEHTKEKLTLALNFDEANDSYSQMMTIPSGMIIKVKGLK